MKSKAHELTTEYICSLVDGSPNIILREEECGHLGSAAKVEEAFIEAVESGLCKRIGETRSIFLTLKGRESLINLAQNHSKPSNQS